MYIYYIVFSFRLSLLEIQFDIRVVFTLSKIIRTKTSSSDNVSSKGCRKSWMKTRIKEGGGERVIDLVLKIFRWKSCCRRWIFVRETIRRLTMPKSWKNDEISEEKQIASLSYRILREKKRYLSITLSFIPFVPLVSSSRKVVLLNFRLIVFHSHVP